MCDKTFTCCTWTKGTLFLFYEVEDQVMANLWAKFNVGGCTVAFEINYVCKRSGALRVFYEREVFLTEQQMPLRLNLAKTGEQLWQLNLCAKLNAFEINAVFTTHISLSSRFSHCCPQLCFPITRDNSHFAPALGLFERRSCPGQCVTKLTFLARLEALQIISQLSLFALMFPLCEACNMFLWCSQSTTKCALFIFV